MKYDVSMHVPSQVEGLLVAFQKAEIPTLERTLDNIKNIIKDPKFQKDLIDYENKRLNKITQLDSKALEASKKIDGKNFSEYYTQIEIIKNNFVLANDNVEKEYWNHIKDYITLYLNKIENTEENEEEDEV